MRRALVASVLAAALGGCGLGPGDEPAGTRLTVTQDFGTRAMRRLEAPEVSGRETVMRFLQRNARVATRFGGAFVQSIDGVGGGQERGRPFDWFFYVNGVEAGEGAAATTLGAGDRVWWDRHDWGAAMRVPAVVGSFPEPFVHGIAGKRLPVRVECTDPQAASCETVVQRLADLDVPAARGRLLSSRVEQTLRVVVGPWVRVRVDPALRALEQGPQRSGVYARPSADGRRLALLDARGRSVRALGAGAGLVAATRLEDAAPVWVVTGTDAAGVTAAAGALREPALRDRFAVVVEGARAVGVPVEGAGR